MSKQWAGKAPKNGELLGKAQEAGFESFITADKNMPYQQSMKRRPFALVVLDIHPNILANQSACVPLVEVRLGEFKPGQVYLVEGPHSKRNVH